MDDIRKDQHPHEFTWQMMFSDAMAVTLGDGRAVFQPIQASGNAYVDTPADLFLKGTRKLGRPAVCALDFDVSGPGEYVLWARVRTLSKDRGKADSFNVRMDDGELVAWHMSGKRAWTWQKVSSGIDHTPVTYELSVGKHKLAVQMREPGAQVDCLFLTRDGDVVPSLFAAQGEPLLLEAEAGQLVEPMRLVQVPESETRMVVRVHADSEVSLATDAFRPTDYHTPAAFPRFRATTHDVNPRFIAVLLPLPAGATEPGVTFEAGKAKRTVQIKWSSHTDTLVWSQGDGSATLLDVP